MSSLSDLSAHRGYWLRMVSNAVSHAFARALAVEDVTMAEWVLMRVLNDHQPMAPSGLADQMGMTRGAITKLAERLAIKGLVARQEHGTDKRAHYLLLTEEGAARLPRLAALADQNDATFFGVLEADELSALDRLLRRLVEQHGLKDLPVD